MYKAFLVILVTCVMASLSLAHADDFRRVEFRSSAGSHYSSKMALSRSLCTRITGNINQCTKNYHCGTDVLWPAQQQYLEINNWVKKGSDYHVSIKRQDNYKIICTIK